MEMLNLEAINAMMVVWSTLGLNTDVEMLDLETINAMDVDVDDDVSDNTILSVWDDNF